ncbi:Transposable element Tc1 [Brachionus plicatilis]|uniref:Transposable element Tc1 n=1 Tax=Brachionus plicatilis TaxID=10195 RepID=A0A3M7QF54_BRAPC|nr:Transposable element Tc1 [Brachionus plicatilis]
MCENTRKNNDIYGNPKESTRPGRPIKLTYRDQNSLFIQIRKNPTISNKNRETVRRFLTSKREGTYTALKKSLLTALDRIKKLQWCKERLNWRIERWGIIVFSDESNFEKNTTLDLWYQPYKVVVVPREYGDASALKVNDAVVYMRGELINMETLENELLASVDIFY